MGTEFGALSSEIQEKFNSYHWHDSKVTSFNLVRRTEEEKIIEDFLCEISLIVDPNPAHYKWTSARLTFKNCLAVKIDLNLKGKSFCSDDISEAYCESQSSLKQVIGRELGYPYDQRAQLPKFLDPLEEGCRTYHDMLQKCKLCIND